MDLFRCVRLRPDSLPPLLPPPLSWLPRNLRAFRPELPSIDRSGDESRAGPTRVDEPPPFPELSAIEPGDRTALLATRDFSARRNATRSRAELPPLRDDPPPARCWLCRRCRSARILRSSFCSLAGTAAVIRSPQALCTRMETALNGMSFSFSIASRLCSYYGHRNTHGPKKKKKKKKTSNGTITNKRTDTNYTQMI